MSFVPERLTCDFALAMVRRNSNGISYTEFLFTLFSAGESLPLPVTPASSGFPSPLEAGRPRNAP